MKDKAHYKEFFDIILKLKNQDEVESFMSDILTPQELDAVTERWQIVKMLMEGEHSQREIATELSVALATVTRGNRQLNYGNGGFKKTFEQLKK
ncbi:MAG: Trp operon repressor [Oceanicoccus sp.]|jgi:Trp operon repressor